MRSHLDNLLFSATDLVNFLGCAHASSLDRNELVDPGDLRSEDPIRTMLQDYGHAHEQRYLETLKASGHSVVEIPTKQPLDVMAEQTTKAMQNGADVIYQGVLISSPWHGYADFLRKVNGTPSKFGNYSYEVVDTKLSSVAKPKHVFQLCIYSEMVALQQGYLPEKMHLILGDQSEVSLLVKDFIHYSRFAAARLGDFQNLSERKTTAEPCGHCLYCKWKERCEKEWESNDHLSLIARISKSQISRLRDFGIDTMEAVASITTEKVTGIRTPILERLRDQASLQTQKRRDGKNVVKLLPAVEKKGFARMPATDSNDMFFDIEGFPLIEDGLEYLWGFDHLVDGSETFTGYWAHDRTGEKKAFQDAVDLMITTIDRHPNAHIYHYASYEKSALQRLSTFHGTREAEVDRLLRQNKLVDLYAVVREGIQVSEPAYSLKNLEVFFAPERKEEVKSGTESIIVYDNWRKTGNQELLDSIEKYNAVDCKSTRMCRDWLLELRPTETPWFKPDEIEALKAIQTEEVAAEREAQSVAMQEALVAGIPPEDQEWHETVGYLLEFHRREDKSEWWKMFDRLEKSIQDQIEDPLCIGGLTVDPDRKPVPEKKSFIHFLRFPPQDVKLCVGDKPLRSDTKKSVSEIVSVDAEAGVMSVKIGPSHPAFPEVFSLVAPGPIMAEAPRDAVWRYAAAVAEGKTKRYRAVTSILAKEKPRLSGRKKGSAVANTTTDLVAAVTDAVSAMNETHLLIQGPPGTGKTFTSAHAIVQLLKDGKRVGVTSNSHKAINNLLARIHEVAIEKGVTFRGVKKSGSEEDGLKCAMIEEATKNERAEDPSYDLVGGTAWLFSREAFDQQLDYIFVDEAGQVCLANIVAVGTAAKNIVLVGDQMQLSQPTQGIHPGNSGISALEYLLEGHGTVPDDRGVLLNVTRRLHPSICTFISDAVYDGKLQPHAFNSERYLLTKDNAPFPIAEYGMVFAGVDHEGCSQESPKEVEQITATFNALLEQRIHCGSEERAISVNDILVVSPYNMQVNALRRALPPGARVGTVDKFQGQEAAVVLISMTTSSGEEMPRNIEFLFSTQRLNVAISRAECLAVIFASPRLLEISCNSIEQLRLVNALCWAREYSGAIGQGPSRSP